MNRPGPIRVVIDTSVLIAAARSRHGASFAVINSIPSPDFHPCLSVSLYAEWQDVLTRPENLPAGQTIDDAKAFLQYLASQSYLQDIHFLWRPFSSDPDDDMVLELAFAAGCEHIITHNVSDFHSSEQLGVTAVTPRDFLNRIRKSV
jgi:putative PIN family toxin of toxin-antitoxin system